MESAAAMELALDVNPNWASESLLASLRFREVIFEGTTPADVP